MSKASRQRAREQRRRRERRRRLALLLCALVMLASLLYMLHYELTRRAIEQSNEEFSALYVLPEITPGASESIPDAGETTTYGEEASPSESNTALSAGESSPQPSEPASATPPTASQTEAVPPENVPEETETTPTASPAVAPTSAATPSLMPTITPTPSPEPTPSPTLPIAVDVTLEPEEASSEPEPSERVTPAPEASGAPAYPQPGAKAAPRATADADTLVVALETPPPVQESFGALLETNPDAVGFLTIDGVLSLPVAQRLNDNEYYLNHSFDGGESIGGTLFLDGANLLTPEDDCLVVYGHNMRNGTMFQPLPGYEKLEFLREHPLVRFDTLYENRVWVPFAALTLTADVDSERYLDIREFTYDELGFDLFVQSLRALSTWKSPVEVEYGDKLLLLVTCEYTHNNGRFVLALRAQRDYESELQLRSEVQASR